MAQREIDSRDTFEMESRRSEKEGTQQDRVPFGSSDNLHAVPEDDFSVWWNDSNGGDPENPMNWPSGRKWSIIGILSMLTFLTPLASSMLAPGVPAMMAEFKSDDASAKTFVVSIFVLGFAVGPLLMAPMSELYGRTPVYHVCNSLFVVFTIACALADNIGMMLAFRFFAGFFGVAVVTCGSGSIADLMPAESRGRAMAIWSVGPLLGPVIGPVCAGFLVEEVGWRWVFWVTSIVSGVAVLVSFLVLRETYAPVILERKAAKLRKETGNDAYQPRDTKREPAREQFAAAIVRPVRLFIFSPIVTLMCIYVAVCYGLLYILFTTFAFVYTEIYGFSAVGTGLSFIGGGIGNFLGLLFVGYWSDKLIQKAKAGGQQPQPEQRLDLSLTVPATLTLPIGLFVYGWTADQQVHWIAPMIGTGIMGFGTIGIFMIIQTYLVDAYTTHAASVTAANAVLRSLLGALFPLFGLQLYDALGLGWGNSLLGFLALALAPVPWLLHRFGAQIRMNPRFQKKF